MKATANRYTDVQRALLRDCVALYLMGVVMSATSWPNYPKQRQAEAARLMSQ